VLNHDFVFLIRLPSNKKCIPKVVVAFNKIKTQKSNKRRSILSVVFCAKQKRCCTFGRLPVLLA
jgi:hypothetical protein